MLRDPSLHITYSDFSKILKRTRGFSEVSDSNILELFKRCKSKTCNRIYIPIAKTVDKVNRVVSSSMEDANLMANIIYMERQRLHHRGIAQTKPSSPDWLVIKDIAKCGDDFYEEFKDDFKTKREAYIALIEIAFSKMNRPMINRIRSLYPLIVQIYEAKLILLKDPLPEDTTLAHNYYMGKLAEKTGVIKSYVSIPEQYVWFQKAAQDADKASIGIRLWIESQFYFFNLMDKYPELPQLIGPKALDRVQKYIVENKLVIGSNNKRR